MIVVCLCDIEQLKSTKCLQVFVLLIYTPTNSITFSFLMFLLSFSDLKMSILPLILLVEKLKFIYSQ